MTTVKFTTAIARFKRANSDWLDDTHLPAVASLEHMATELDKRLVPALVSAYGVAYRALVAQKPEAPEDADELDELLSEVGW